MVSDWRVVLELLQVGDGRYFFTVAMVRELVVASVT
jgi:hypothetical protein